MTYQNKMLKQQDEFYPYIQPNPISISNSLHNKYRYRCKQAFFQKDHQANKNMFNQSSTTSNRSQNQLFEPYCPSKIIDKIIQQSLTSEYIYYRDLRYFDQIDQFMKRQYFVAEYQKKIDNLSQYYKFHRNLPVWNDKSVGLIMQKHYNKIKDIDYKVVKSILKKEQGISLTTRKSFSSFQQSSYTVYSKYSNMLDYLQNSNDSVILREFCDKIDKELKKVKVQKSFKGTYYSGQNKFEQFLRKQERRKQNIHKQSNKKQSQKQSAIPPAKQLKSYQKKKVANQNILSLTRENNIFPPKPRKINQKTSQNQLLSEEKLSRRQFIISSHQTQNLGSRPHKKQFQTSKQKQKQKFKSTSKSKDCLKSDWSTAKIKHIRALNVGQSITKQNSNYKKKQLKRIPFQEQQKQNMHGQLLNKPLMKCKSKSHLTERSRSNSIYNLQNKQPNNATKQLNINQLKNGSKTNRSTSKSKLFNIPIAKGKQIQLNQISHPISNSNSKSNFNKTITATKLLKSRQSSQKNLRSISNSVKNIDSRGMQNNCYKFSTSTNENQTRKNIQIEQGRHFQPLSTNKIGHSLLHSKSKASTTNLNLKPNEGILININLNQDQILKNNKSRTSFTTNNKTSSTSKIFKKVKNQAVENIMQKKLISIKRKLLVN